MIDPLHLKALVAVAQTGTFERAAEELSVTQSAVSQRIKALEDRLGAPVLIRGQPCTATDIGRRLIRHAQDVALMESATLRDIGQSSERPTVRIALNADSLATWVLPAFASVDHMLFDIVIDDQDHSADWLRTGGVAAAICSRAEPVHGCDVYALGGLDYLATASPAFAAQHFSVGLTEASLRAAPSLAFNAKDRLQADFVRREIGKRIALPVHHIASTEAFVSACRLGLGWGLNPVVLVRDLIESGSLVALSAEPLSTPLFWQVSRLVAEPLAPLTEAIKAQAQINLTPF